MRVCRDGPGGELGEAGGAVSSAETAPPALLAAKSPAAVTVEDGSPLPVQETDGSEAVVLRVCEALQ